MNTDTDANEMNAKYDRIRKVLHSHCSEEEFHFLQCPQCGSKLMCRVNDDGKRFFVRCIIDSKHLAMHGKNEAPPVWFQQAPHSGWYGGSQE
jgi:hypothetical protein